MCSLSSSCLSEIWGGGWGGEEEYKSARSQRAAAPIKVCHRSETVSSPHQPPQGRTKCECMGDLVHLPQRCGIQDRWPAFWTGGLVLDSLLWQQREQCYCGKNARAITSFWKPSTELITSPYDLSNTAGNVKICFLGLPDVTWNIKCQRLGKLSKEASFQFLHSRDLGSLCQDTADECLSFTIIWTLWRCSLNMCSSILNSYSLACRVLSQRERPSPGRARWSWRQNTAACSSHSSWQSPSVGS